MVMWMRTIFLVIFLGILDWGRVIGLAILGAVMVAVFGVGILGSPQESVRSRKRRDNRGPLR
jgi:hypothetical protein